MTLFQIMKKTTTLNWEVFSVRRITNLRAFSLPTSSIGSLRVGKDWGKGRSSPSPLFSPAPCRAPARPHPSEQHPLAGESLVNQSQSINISVTYKDAPDSILFPGRKDYPGYLVWTDARENDWRYLDRGGFSRHPRVHERHLKWLCQEDWLLSFKSIMCWRHCT